METKNKEDNYTLRKLQMDIPIPISNFFRTPYIPIKDAVDRFQFQYIQPKSGTQPNWKHLADAQF